MRNAKINNLKGKAIECINDLAHEVLFGETNADTFVDNLTVINKLIAKYDPLVPIDREYMHELIDTVYDDMYDDKTKGGDNNE
jgi:hypothetical protein